MLLLIKMLLIILLLLPLIIYGLVRLILFIYSIINKNKEAYPPIGTFKPFDVRYHINEQNIIDTNATNIADRILNLTYNGNPPDFPTEVFEIPDINKFSRPFAMTNYLLISFLYIKEFSWENQTGIKDPTKNQRGKNWCIGPLEFLSSKEGGFIDKKIKEIEYAISCLPSNIDSAAFLTCYTNNNSVDSGYFANTEQACYYSTKNLLKNRCNKENTISSEVTEENLLNVKDKLIRIKQLDDSCLILRELILLNKDNPDIIQLDRIKFPKLLYSRTSPCIYEKNFTKEISINNSASLSLDSEFPSNCLTQSERNRYITIKNVEIPICDSNSVVRTDQTCLIIQWVQNLGACSIVDNIDFGQSLIRQIGSIYKKPNNSYYFLTIRGIVHNEEQNKIVLDAEPYNYPNTNYKVHGGFYKYYTNRPVPYDVKKSKLGINTLCTNTGFLNTKTEYNRTYYEEYFRKGSLKDQIRKFFNDNKNSDGTSKIPNLVISGHSMGAGIVQVILTDILLNNLYPKEKIVCYLLNTPRSINIELMTFITDSLSGRIYSVMNSDDTVVTLPMTNMEIEIGSKKVLNTEETDKRYKHFNVSYIDNGFNYCHFNNIIGYNYDYYSSIISNHFLSGFNFGINRFFNNVYSPNVDLTQDIILNGIYQAILNENVIGENIENERGCFLGTSNPAYWNRGYLINKNKVSGPYITNFLKIPTLFPDFYPEKYYSNNIPLKNHIDCAKDKEKGYLFFSAIIYLIKDFITNRLIDGLKPIYQNILDAINSEIINSGNNGLIFFNRNHNIWKILYGFFDNILMLLENGTKITVLNDCDPYYLNLSRNNISELRIQIQYIHTDGTISLKCITRTLYLLICPPNLKYIKENNEYYIKNSICSLLNYLGYIKYNHIGRKNLNDFCEYKGNFYYYINSYLSRLGLYHDLLNYTLDGSGKYNDLYSLSVSSNYRKNSGYPNIDYRIWEMLFGEIGKVSKNIVENATTTIINGNSYMVYRPYNPIMTLSKAHGLLFNSNLVITNQLSNIERNYRMKSKFGTFKYLGTSNVLYNSCELNNSCDNLLIPSQLSCSSSTNKQFIPFPGYDIPYLSNDRSGRFTGKCYKANLLTRFGKSLNDCFNSYDPLLSEFLIKYFHDTEDKGEIPVVEFMNAKNIGNCKINCNTCDDKIDYKISKVHLVPTFNDVNSYLQNIDTSSELNGLQPRTISANIYKMDRTNILPKDVFLITINTQWFDKPFLMGRVLFDMIVKDLMYGILYSNKDNIIEAINKAWKNVKEYYEDYTPLVALGGVSSFILGIGLGGITGGIAIATGGIGLIALAVAAIIMGAAEEQGTDSDKIEYLLSLIPEFILEDLIDQAKADEIDPQISNLSDKIGSGYASSLIMRYIDRFIDFLLKNLNTVLNPNDIPFWISWRKEILKSLDNKPCLNYSFIPGNESWNINSIPAKFYCNLRSQIFDKLKDHIVDENYHVFITGYGTGGSIAHCMMLDGALTNNHFNVNYILNDNNQYQISTDSKLNNFAELIKDQYSKFTYYSYASPRVFNSVILNWLGENNKSTLYNILNADDFFTHYPNPSLATYVIKKDKLSYSFSNYPSTLIFNIPIGMDIKERAPTTYQSRYSDLIGLSYRSANNVSSGSGRVNLFQYINNGVNDPTHKPTNGYNNLKVYLSHRPSTYMKGAIDLHNKIFGGWFVNTLNKDTPQQDIKSWIPKYTKDVNII